MKSVDEQKKKRFVATSFLPTLKNYTFNRAARAGLCNPFRIAHIEDKGRLPHGVAHDFGKQASPQRRISQRLFMIGI